MRGILIAAGLGLVFAPYLMAPKIAAADSSDCGLRDKFDELKSFQESSANLDYFEALRKELGMRQNILTGILDCAISEAENLQTSVKGISPADPDIKILRDRLAERIGETASYYEDQKSKVKDLGIRGTKDAARSVKEWRMSRFAPLAEEATQLLIWTKNQEFFAAAQKRYNEIEGTVKFFKLIDNSAMIELLNTAAENLRAARTANDSAEQTLLRFGATEDSMTEIKNSLQFLADTYNAFFDLSKAINLNSSPQE